jgi:hypothetical protein
MVEVESLRNSSQQLERRLNDNQRLSEIGQINEIDLINIRVQLLESKNQLFEMENNLGELSAAFYASYQITAAELGQLSDWTPSQIAAAIASLGVQNIYDLRIRLANITYLIEYKNQFNPRSTSSLSLSTDLFLSNSDVLANTIPELFNSSGLSSIYPVVNLSLVISSQDWQAKQLSTSIIENLKTMRMNAISKSNRDAEIFIQTIESDTERLANRLVDIVEVRDTIRLAAADADDALYAERIKKTDYDQILELLNKIDMQFDVTEIELIFYMYCYSYSSVAHYLNM